MCEHLRISALTGKRVKGDDDSAIKEHLLFCNQAPDFEDFSILAWIATWQANERCFVLFTKIC